MQVPQFNQAIKQFDHIDGTKLPELVINIKKSLQVYATDYNKLGHALYRLCEQIMKIKDVKSQNVPYYEDLICQVIKISIKNQYRVGFDAMRFVFNLNSQFYKSSNLDMSLNFPLGKDRPLKQYNPEVGQQCDTVKPYITSTSFCGWTRCVVLQVENNKYTISYANYTNPNTVRQKPWFAPLGSRTTDYEWRMGLQVGTLIQALLNRVWYKSTVVQVGQQNGTKKVRVTYRRFSKDGERKDSQGNTYSGLPISEDQWIDVLSPRIQKCGKMADNKLCYYTFSSQEILLDDSYDIIFQQEYKQHPFYAIMRVISCKSLSLIKFINTFITNGGLQKVMAMMDFPEFNDQIIYSMLSNIGVMVAFFPRMFIKTPIILDFYNKIFRYFQTTVKTLNPFKIDMGYFCYDVLGRRLFSLSEIYYHQNQLRKVLVKQFLKMNMQKQMLAVRYINDLIAPKKQYTLEERQSFNQFLRSQKIFQQIFNSNTHQQIISRTPVLLQYMIKKQIITLKQFQSLWKIVPITDTRGRAMIQKLLTQISKQIPINFVECLIQKILLLKENQLTVENLNLLKQLKNRKIDNNNQMRILSFLWDLLTVKSGNVKTTIQQEVQKVFKAFISTIKDPIVRMNLLQSMSQKLQDCKRVKNQIQLLKDFIKSYPQKYQKLPQQQNYGDNVPLTIYQAIAFLKTKDIYQNLLKLLSRSKQEGVKKDILQLISFLFENDFGDINQIIQFIFQRLGPSFNFLEWVHKLLDRSLDFIVDLLEKTTDFAFFQNISDKSFEKLQQIIIDVNKSKNNFKIVKVYHYKNTSSSTSAKPQQKLIGPLLPQVKYNFCVLVSPFKLIGMKFLQNLLLIVKQTRVYNLIIKLIIQFISNLDQSIQSKSEAFRRQFLQQIFKQIKKIVGQNKTDDKITAKLQTYLNLFFEIFSETQKTGSGDLQPHYQRIEGQKITLNIQNQFEKQKGKDHLQKFSLICNQNISLWALKQKISQILNVKPQIVDVIKYSDPMDESNNVKSLAQLIFYDNQAIKTKKKLAKDLNKQSLLNQHGTDVSQKLQKIVLILFQQYKNKQLNGLSMVQMVTLADERWKGSLFKQKDRLQKIFEEHDKQKKGYLSFKDLKQFFYKKSITNQNAIWRLINLSGFKNDLSTSASTVSNQQMIPINTSALPRRILSCPQIYDLIFQILHNQNFKEAHLNFYKLLTMLETDQRVIKEIKNNLKILILQQKSIYKLGYIIQIANSQLSKQQNLYFEFWKNNGFQIIQQKIKSIIGQNINVYGQELLTKNAILPGLVKILNMYINQILSQNKIAKFVGGARINCLEPTDFISKVKQIKNINQKLEISQVGKKLLQLDKNTAKLKSVFKLMDNIFHSLMKNYDTIGNQYLQKLTIQVVRLLGCLVSSEISNEQFSTVDHLYGIKSGSLNFRRSTIILIYIYLFYSGNRNPQQIEQLIVKLLQQMPNQNKFQYEEYFNVLNQLISRYIQINYHNKQKDQYFVELANSLLNILFTNIQPQSRTAFTSNKLIIGILVIFQTIIKKDSICKILSTRKAQFIQNCLFAYNVQEKLNKIEITHDMLTVSQQSLHFKNYVICKTDSTRQIAYKIVARLHQLSNQDGEDFIGQFILPIIKGISEEVRLTSSRGLGVGLKNFGSTCYMNSMLQVLNTVQPFRNSLMKCNSDHPVLKQLKNIFAALYFSQRVDYAPGNLLNAFVPPINPGIQQDTTEFLNFLFDQLQVALMPTRYKKVLDQIFKGTNTSQMICHSCGYKKQNKEPFFSFGVEIQGKVDLQSALEGSYQGEIISDYLCDSCQNRGQTKKRNILSQIPSIMFIHLRRIVFNYDMFVNMKIHTRLQFPQQLNIEPYTKEGVQLRQSLGLQYMKSLSHNEEQNKKFEKLAEHNKQKDFYKLKLKGVIVHSGSADVGHYYSILQNDKLWRKYDDSRVGIFTQSDFEQKCYGGTFISDEWGSGTSANAYVLVYEKVVKNPIQILPQKQNEPQQIIKYNEIKIYNSPEDYRKLWIDNHNFMIETQLLQSKTGKYFINFMCKLLQSSPKCPNKIQIISELIYRVSFHSGYTGDLLKILVQNVQNVSPQIFYGYVIGNKNRTLKLLLNAQKALRDFMSNYLQIVLLQSYKKGYDKVKSDILQYISQLLNAMTGQVAKNWLRVDGYFKLMYLLVSSSISFIGIYKFFLSRNLISTLIDFILQKQSPVKINPKNYSLGTKTNPVDFNYGIATICFLLRHSYGFNGKNYETIVIPEQFFYHLNNNDITCLSFMEFYRKMLRERQNLFDLAVIIQRLCMQNLQFSKAICQSILQAIGSITDSKDQMLDFSFIVLQILKIRDQLWVQRAQMLLGIGIPYVINQNLMATFDEERYVFTSNIYDIFPIECLFSYVYLYRLKNTLACFQLLKSIIQGCTVSEVGMRYLARQPSPNYLFPNFITWIQSFISTFIGLISPDPKQKQRIQVDIATTLKYIQDIKQYIEKYPGIDFYRSVITGQITNKTQLQRFEKDGVQIKLYQYEVYCYQSKPSKIGWNSAMDQYLQTSKLTKPVTNDSNILKFFKKPGKSITLKIAPVQEDQDKQLFSLFDQKPYSPTTQIKDQNSKPQIKQQQLKPLIPQSQQKQPDQPTQIQINLKGVFLNKYFRQIQVINMSKQKKVVHLTFTSENNSNFIIPKTFSWKVFSKNNQSLWMAKQNVQNNWGDLQMKCQVQQYIKQKHQRKNVNTWWFKTYENSQKNIEFQFIENENNQKPLPQDDKKQPVKQEPVQKIPQSFESNSISCPVCTFANQITMTQCEMCTSPLY